MGGGVGGMPPDSPSFRGFYFGQFPCLLYICIYNLYQCLALDMNSSVSKVDKNKTEWRRRRRLDCICCKGSNVKNVEKKVVASLDTKRTSLSTHNGVKSFK